MSAAVKRTRAYDVSKHLTIREAVEVCKLARQVVEDFDAMRDVPNAGNVNAFMSGMDRLRRILAAEGEA